MLKSCPSFWIGFDLCLSNFVIFYKMVASWMYMYEGIDKVMNIHTLVLDVSAIVLQPKGWHSVLLWSLGMPQLRNIFQFILSYWLTEKDTVLWMKHIYGTSSYLSCYLQTFHFFMKIELLVSIADNFKAH
jgi:hypothetical protein